MTVSAVLGPVALSADERMADGLMAALRGDARTRVLLVHGDRTPVVRDDAGAVLAPVAPPDVIGPASWAFLGRDADGSGVLLAALTDPPQEAPAGEWASFRESGAALAPGEADLLATAVALGRWHVDAAHCPACGERAGLTTAGWVRRCDACRREHFPRTDPAVIVGITSADGERILLGANAAWGGRMYSCFAGFVEAGESAEQTVHREIAEEAGVRVRDIRYIASQAWPYPRSLMLGFHATAVDESEVRPDGEEIVDARWFTREEIARGLRGEGEFGFPGGVSVAHRLIRAWHDARPGSGS
ncbi:NAD(+) diphosphatase [Microbacterium karelineae]|uniref:NAD(+) diphosphatase n=1 Tax=Microbacterium karelineae TaxID=2654283 RepID=UPI0018D2863A|nr:NAD(+) diphosphatase [Microbacterium karelineae]